MKTKFANRLIAVIIIAVMTIMCCISPQSLRFDTVLPEKAEIQAYAEGTKSSDYNKAMQLYEEKCYEWLNGNGAEEITCDSHFQVFDLSYDEDGIPELIITPSIARGANCYVYMYYNGGIFEKNMLFQILVEVLNIVNKRISVNLKHVIKALLKLI